MKSQEQPHSTAATLETVTSVPERSARSATAPSSTAVRRIDTRQATSVRELLEWAYQREMVRFAGSPWADEGAALSAAGSSTGRLCDVLGDGYLTEGNGWRGSPSAHPDAEWLHAFVMREFETEDRWRIIRAAESGTPPEWDPVVPALKVVRLMKASGKPRMYVCPVARRPVAERIAVVGVGAGEAAMIRVAARKEWQRWVALLAVMRDRIVIERAPLKRWQVTGIGAESEPWRGK